MNYAFAALLIFFTSLSFAAEITDYQTKEMIVEGEALQLKTITIKFPSGNTAVLEELVESDSVIVHLIVKDREGIKLESRVIAYEPIFKIPNQPQSSKFSISKEKALYNVEPKDNFIIFGTKHDIIVFREDGENVRFVTADQQDGKSLDNVYDFDLRRFDNGNILAYKYAVNGKYQTINVNFPDAVKDAEQTVKDKATTTTAEKPAVEKVKSPKINVKGLKINKNGASIVVAGKTTPITKDKVLQYSILNEKNHPGQIVLGNQQSKVAVLVTEKEIFLVTQKGIIRKVDADRAKINATTQTFNETSVQVIEPLLTTIESEGKTFAILDLEYDSAAEATGETFVMDIETNDFVRVAYSRVSYAKEQFIVNDGILSLQGIDRKIDLRNLKGENSFFKAQLPMKLKDKSNSNYDAVKEHESVFANIAEDFRTGRKKAFAIDEDSKDIMKNLTAVMAQKESPNPMLVAEAGTGKTSMVYGFFDQVIKGKIPGVPRTVRIYELTSSTIGQGTHYTGSLEQRLKALEATAGLVPVIIFADETHTLRGAGTHEGNPDNDILSMLRNALLNGTLHMIGTSTEDEFNNTFGGDSSLMRRFSLVKKPAPTHAMMLTAIDSWTERYGYPSLSTETKEYLIAASNRFVVYGAQPSKATSLMDKAFARKISLTQSNAAITKEDIIDALIASGTDRKLFETKSAAEIIENLKKGWAESVSGQEQARDAYIELETLRLGGLLNPNKPASLLVTGPRGAGKTRGAKIYAKYTNRSFVKFNMSDYAEGGVAEFQKRLAQEIFKDRFAVMVFDEIEKAAPEVKNILLAILEDGVTKVPAKLTASASTNNSMQTLDFTQATVVATSNAGADFVMNIMKAGSIPKIGFSSNREEKKDITTRIQNEVMMQDHLKQAAFADGLSMPILDRFILIAPAFPSKADEFRDVIDINLTQMLSDYSNIKGFNFEIMNRDEFLDFAVQAYYQENISNRIVETILHKHIRKWIGKALTSLEQKNIKKALIEFEPQSGEARVITTCEDALK